MIACLNVCESETRFFRISTLIISIESRECCKKYSVLIPVKDINNNIIMLMHLQIVILKQKKIAAELGNTVSTADLSKLRGLF